MSNMFNNRISELKNIVDDHDLLTGIFAILRHASPTPINGAISVIEQEIDNDNQVNFSITQRIKALKMGYTSEQFSLYRLDKCNPELFVSEFIRQAYTRQINNKPLLLDNKKKFHEYMSEKGFDDYIPYLYGFIKKGEFTGNEKFKSILKKDNKLVIKPNKGASGRNVYICESKDDHYLINGEKYDDIEKFIEKLNDFIVTEYCNQSDFLKNIYPKSANTIRILTMNPECKDPFIADAALRLGTKRSGFVDNRSSGGFTVDIDLETGELSKAAECLPSGNINWHDSHPDTNSKIEGVNIPDWNNLKKEFLECVKKFPKFKYVGWDILLTEENNFVIIEGNSKPGLIIFQVHHPLLENQKVKKFFLECGVPI